MAESLGKDLRGLFESPNTRRSDPEAAAELRVFQYSPLAVKRYAFSRAAKRNPIGFTVTVRDRIRTLVSMIQVTEPLFEREFAQQSYGCRSGKGCKEALRRVEELSK